MGEGGTNMILTSDEFLDLIIDNCIEKDDKYGFIAFLKTKQERFNEEE